MGTCFGTYTCLSMIEHNWEKIGSAFSIHSRKFDKIRVLRIKFGRNTKKNWRCLITRITRFFDFMKHLLLRIGTQRRNIIYDISTIFLLLNFVCLYGFVSCSSLRLIISNICMD